jgi:histidyl-tRNA synthetase
LLIAYLDAEAENAAFELARAVRAKGVKTELYLGDAKPKKIFTHTDRRGHRAVIMIGSNEIQTGEIEIKRLKDQEKARIKMDRPEDIQRFLEL